jgi:nicotinate-nucleotide adenylyltransferase
MTTSTLCHAVFGGAFNPPHLGHLASIRHLLSLPQVDRVVVIPSVAHAFGKQMPSVTQRMDMLQLLWGELTVEEQQRVDICDVESKIQAGKPFGSSVYSLEVLDHLSERFKSISFKLALGPDNCRPDVFSRFFGSDTLKHQYGILEIPDQSFERSTLCRQLLSHPDTLLSVLISHMPLSVVSFALRNHLYETLESS